MNREELVESVAIVDESLQYPACHSDKHCGGEVWADAVQDLELQTLCALKIDVSHPHLQPAVDPSPSGVINVRSLSETLEFLQGGGSLVRMNDGEFLMMDPVANSPLMRTTDTLLRLQITAHALCPGLCVGILDPNNPDAVEALGPAHHSWWTQRGFRLTRHLIQSGILPANRNYCFGMATYRPKQGPHSLSLAQFTIAWNKVFENRSVLLVQPRDGQFQKRCGGCVQISSMLYGHGRKLPPFQQARYFTAFNPDLLRYSHVAGAEWHSAVSSVRRAADQAKADTVAVSWGPFADILVSELVCRGLRALDIGNLISILHGGSEAQGTDPDEDT